MHLVLLPSWYPTPENPIHGIFFRDLAQALRRAGYRVGVMTFTIHRQLILRAAYSLFGRSSHELDEGIPTYRISLWTRILRSRPISGYYWAVAANLLGRYAAQYGLPDVIHAHSVRYAGVFARYLKGRYGIPYILTEHSSVYALGRIPAREAPQIRDALADAEIRTVVSPSLGGILESHYGDVVHPWEWVPNMVGDCFRPAPTGRSSEGPFRFLNVALMSEVKGQADLLRAYADRFRGDKSVQLRIGGDGPLSDALREMAVALGIGQQVVFLGRLSREQVVAEMQQVDVFVLPSHYETFGVALVEALACGTPVIASACGGPEAIVHEANGVLFPPHDIEELGAAMAWMREHGDRYDSREISDDCMSRFGEEAVIAQWAQIYEAVIGRHRGGPHG